MEGPLAALEFDLDGFHTPALTDGAGDLGVALPLEPTFVFDVGSVGHRTAAGCSLEPDFRGFHAKALADGAGDLSIATRAGPADVLGVHPVAYLDVGGCVLEFDLKGFHATALPDLAGRGAVADPVKPAQISDVGPVAHRGTGRFAGAKEANLVVLIAAPIGLRAVDAANEIGGALDLFSMGPERITVAGPALDCSRLIANSILKVAVFEVAFAVRVVAVEPRGPLATGPLRVCLGEVPLCGGVVGGLLRFGFTVHEIGHAGIVQVGRLVVDRCGIAGQEEEGTEDKAQGSLKLAFHLLAF